MLKLTNTMTGSKENFKPLEPGKVKIFACGPSIYQRPHIGNYRTFLYEDMLDRYLEYSGYKVNHSMILTDIEDKAISEAKKKHKIVSDLTEDAAEIFFKESKMLDIRLPDPVPRATGSIKESAQLIKKLMKTEYAYRYNGDIYFDALKFKEFGKLFKLDKKRWPKKKIHFKRDTYTGRRWNLGDFILWHGYKEGDNPSWDTEIGKGRPSWNIQDPSVIVKHLGYQVDINCGGIDNIYRHHDYNIAVMESLSGKEYAGYYLHGEHLIVGGKSMSKSRGNILYPGDILKNKLQPYHLRFFLLYTHYRKKLNLTDERFKKSCEYLDTIRHTAGYLLKRDNPAKKTDVAVSSLIDKIIEEFENYMDDDLRFGASIDAVFSIMNRLKSIKEKNGIDLRNTERLEKTLKKIDSVLKVII